MPTVPSDDKRPRPERTQTDESLRVEREKADLAAGENLASTDETADDVINRARMRADKLIAAARATTDRQLRPASAPSRERLERQRKLEDQAVRKERADADEVVRAERAEHAAALLTHREETDEDLSNERARSDYSLATRDEFLGIVSHDLLNLLNTMIGFATLIEKDAPSLSSVEQVVSHARRIQRAGGRMNRLIGDLVDVASIEAGTLAVTPELADPAHVVTEAVEAFQAKAAEQGLSLVAELVPPPSLATFDPARILQVLVNLLSNAIKFTPPSGHVVARVERSGDELRFTVSDTGQGIPTEKLEVVFDRFHQLAMNDRRGVGLGLYISKCIVHGHGGRIWAESRQGEGSRFCFTLPIQRRVEAEPAGEP
jgi:signal transduction histidine kinase